MTIIRCNETHLGEYERVARQSFIDAFEKVSEPESFKLYVASAFLPEVLRGDLVSEKAAVYFLKTNEGDTAGYIKLRWDRSDEFFPTEKALELQRIYLLEKYWYKGYGKALLDFSEYFGRENGFLWIWLLVWSENHGAIRFYERAGWEQFAVKDFPFGNEIHHDPALRKSLIF